MPILAISEENGTRDIMFLKGIMAAGLGDKVRGLSDEAIADFLQKELGPQRISSIMGIIAKQADIPSHSALVRQLEATKTLDEVDEAVEWFDRAFNGVIERRADGPWIVMSMTEHDSFSQIRVHVFALMFMDWIVPLFTVEQNIERMIQHDREKNLGYADWLEEKLREGVIG